MKRIFKLEASAWVVVKGERKSRIIRHTLSIDESMINISNKTIVGIFEPIFEGKVKKFIDLSSVRLYKGYLIDGEEYWKDEYEKYWSGYDLRNTGENNETIQNTQENALQN